MANEMRSKDEIVEAVGTVVLEGRELDIQMYILEVLLDIRDLLQRLQSPIIINTDAPESPVSAVHPDTSKK